MSEADVWRGPADDEEPEATRLVPASRGHEMLVGTVLAGKYRILSLLGTGGMGAVYLGEHLHLGRRDAVKVLAQAFAEDPEARARFAREAKNACTIVHANVCAVYDSGETEEGVPFLAMEYVEGETLGQLLKREGPLSLERAAALTVQTTRALEAAHVRGIVHRDIKPGNIMLTPGSDGAETVKVLDFGIAKKVRDPSIAAAAQDEEGQSVTLAGWVVGTPEYLSPEQLKGRPLDGRSDLYSLGILLFEMLTGRRPFSGATWQEVMTNRLCEEPLSLGAAAPGQSFPPDVERVVRRVLRRDAAERHPDAAAFREDLVQAVQAARGLEMEAGELPPTILAEGGVDSQGADAGATGIGGSMSAKLRYAGLALAAAIGVVASVVIISGDGGPEVGKLPPVSSALTPAGAGAVLDRLSLRLGDEPPPPALIAIADTARMVWNLNGVSVGDRAAAAFVLGGTGLQQGDSIAALTWLERAEGLDSGLEGLRALLDSVRTASVANNSAGPEPEPLDSDSGPPGPGGLADAKEVLDRLFISLTSNPSSGTLRAIADTARIYWNLDGLIGEDRAFAAYLTGSSVLEQGDTTAAETWLGRAVALDPDGKGYRTLLDQLRESRP